MCRRKRSQLCHLRNKCIPSVVLGFLDLRFSCASSVLVASIGSIIIATLTLCRWCDSGGSCASYRSRSRLCERSQREGSPQTATPTLPCGLRGPSMAVTLSRLSRHAIPRTNGSHSVCEGLLVVNRSRSLRGGRWLRRLRLFCPGFLLPLLTLLVTRARSRNSVRHSG